MSIWRAQRQLILTVPDNAVIDSGSRQVVFVDKGDGRFEPRDGQDRSTGWCLYRNPRAGSRPASRLSSSANFLIDAESNLKAALKGFDRTARLRQ